MMNDATIKMLGAVPPEKIETYLAGMGWIEVPVQELALKWRKWNAITGEMTELLLPLDRALGDYNQRAAEFLATLATFEGRSSTDILLDFSAPNAPRVRSEKAEVTRGEDSRIAPGESENYLAEQVSFYNSRNSTLERIQQYLKTAMMASALLFLLTLGFFVVSYLVKQPRFWELQDQNLILVVVCGLIACFQAFLVVAFFMFSGKEFERSSSRIFRKLEVEMRGRMFTVLAYVVGEMSITQETLDVHDQEGLEKATSFARQGYELLKKIGGPGEYMALNNLVYYSCVGDYVADRGFLLQSARRLMRAGQENGSINLVLTACRAILQFGTDPAERRVARDTLQSLAETRGLTPKERKEAQLHLRFLRERD